MADSIEDNGNVQVNPAFAAAPVQEAAPAAAASAKRDLSTAAAAPAVTPNAGEPAGLHNAEPDVVAVKITEDGTSHVHTPDSPPVATAGSTLSNRHASTGSIASLRPRSRSGASSRMRFGSVALQRASAPVSTAGPRKLTPFWQNRLFRPLMAIGLYFFSGIIFYTQYEEWTFVDALYFCMVVVTTVGYGDNAPIETDGGKLFTALFALLGVSMVFGGLSIVLAVIQEKSKAVAGQAAKAAVAASFVPPPKECDLASVPEGGAVSPAESNTDTPLPPTPTPPSCDDTVDDEPPSLWHRAKEFYLNSPLLRALMWMLAVMSIGIIFVCSHPNVEVNDDPSEPEEDRYNFVEGVYWVCITGTTVGFGDFSPETQDARLFVIFYLVFLVTATGGFLGELGKYVDVNRKSRRDEVLNRGLSAALIAELDEDGDGEVTKLEWLKGMLVALDEADGELIDIILNQFDNLDRDGSGSLDIDDIKAATEHAESLSPTLRRSTGSFARELKSYNDQKGRDARDDEEGMRVGIHHI
mmetsp:Transcript_31104/g.81504  ORF Transcript_31104/g.81504 Transcript_31104/m.81504 type:complete len:526 (+) Transcript_31104:129-1706(+)